MRAFAVLLAIVVVTAACAGETGPDTSLSAPSTAGQVTTAITQAPTTKPTIGVPSARYVENFEFVWTTIDGGFYDPEFGGVDWDAVHDRYLPQVTAVDSDKAFLELMNAMVFELGVSHLFVLPPDAEFVDPVLTTAGELGITVRLLDGEWVITAIEAGSPAEAAGLRPGYLLDDIGGQRVSVVAASGPMLPPLHARGIRSNQIRAVEELLYGEPDAVTTVGYRDGADQPQRVTLTFQHRGSSAEHLPGYPPVFTTLEVDRLEGGIGYIRFDLFTPALAAPIVAAIDGMRDAPGLVLDVRGNHGGSSDVGRQLIDRLVDEPELIWTWKTRDGSERTYAEPSDDPYEGGVVVLVDIVSSSGAEAFAGGLQAIGRAVIAGERTAGRLLGGEIAQLPMGALMVCPIKQPVTADGTIVEGRGVIPDLPISVHREDLIAGHDPTLQAAIDYLQQPEG